MKREKTGTTKYDERSDLSIELIGLIDWKTVNVRYRLNLVACGSMRKRKKICKQLTKPIKEICVHLSNSEGKKR